MHCVTNASIQLLPKIRNSGIVPFVMFILYIYLLYCMSQKSEDKYWSQCVTTYCTFTVKCLVSVVILFSVRKLAAPMLHLSIHMLNPIDDNFQTTQFLCNQKLYHTSHLAVGCKRNERRELQMVSTKRQGCANWRIQNIFLQSTRLLQSIVFHLLVVQETFWMTLVYTLIQSTVVVNKILRYF